MPPEQAEPLKAAARRKREHALARARRALRELDERGRPISFQAVAHQAAVSRQWLYRQPGLRSEIERLRSLPLDRPHQIPVRERSSEASLRQRVQGLLDENHRLREEIAQLRDELALAYGQLRAAAD